MATAPLSPEDFAHLTGVSRETLYRLGRYLKLLIEWQRAVNLVGASTLSDPWRRHFLDSAQLLSLVPAAARTLIDIGSGAGFPGMVLALMGFPEVHLVEPNMRKCAFLQECARVTGADDVSRVIIHRSRIESLDPFPVDVVTVRALAELPRLLDMCEPFLRVGSVCLLLKGRGAARELTEAGKGWHMTVECFPSRSDPSGTVIRLSQIARA